MNRSLLISCSHTGGDVESSPALSPDGATVFVGSNDGKLYAIEAASGTERWSLQTLPCFCDTHAGPCLNR